MVKLIQYTVQKPLMMVICGHLGGWIYIPLSIFPFPLRVFVPLPLPLPLLPLQRKQYYVSERAPNTQYFGSRQEALRTKCLTIKPNNRWPNPKNNKWVSKANEKRGFCQRFQCGSRVFHESEGDREEFSASYKDPCTANSLRSVAHVGPRIMSSCACKLQRSRWRET